MSGAVTLGGLAASGVIAIGDGYRTRRDEHGRPGYRILRVADVLDGRIEPDGPDFVSERRRRNIGSKLSQTGDVVVTTKGTVGRVSIIPELNQPLVYSPQLCYFRVLEPDILNGRYLSYWFRSAEFRAQASHRKDNTDMAAYINLADIKSMELLLPPATRQRAIAEVLGALDDKIAVNNRLVQSSGELASTHLASALAHGTVAQSVDEAAEFQNRRRVPLSSRQREVRRGTVPYYGAAGVIDHVDEAIFDDRLVLVGEDGSVIHQHGKPVVQYIWGPAWVNNHAHVLTGRSVSTELLKVALERSDVTHLVTGAVQPKISMTNLKSLMLELPEAEQIPSLELLVQSLLALVRSLTEECRSLEAMRDALLPLLMSGKVRVKDAEKIAEEAL